MDEKKKDRDTMEILFSICRFLWTAGQEISRGVFQNRVPARMCYFGIALGLILYFRGDAWLLSKIGSKNLVVSGGLRSFMIYSSLISGWVVWGVSRAAERNRILGKLKVAFESAKLKCNNRYPSLIEDVEVDRYVRKLRLHCHGVPKSDFEREVERLEAVLNMTVVRILQDEGDKSKIEIIYTMNDMDKHVVLEKPDAFADGEVPIGITHEGSIHVNMRDVAHILVAGQSGGGKSNFLKVATTVLTKNNADARVLFLDFKGGMESADIRDHAKNLGDNIECFDGTKDCLKQLAGIGAALEERFKNLASVGASSFDDYLRKKVSRNASANETIRVADEKRTYIIIDEIAQLYSREPDVDKDTVLKAKAAVNRVARQGRAAGVHLIAATQKPDASSFDQTVKANLPGILCFPMANQASSISALGTKRAFELNPNIKGRAIWKFGPKVEEVQTYYFGG